VDDCQNHVPTEADNNLVQELSMRMSEIYDTEAKRADAFRKVLQDHYSITLYAAEVGDTSYRTDGHVCMGRYCFLITEAKREIGSTGSDPYLQAALYYEKFLRDPAAVASVSVLPCFHIFYFGK
jgi:hypothetical protein